MGAGLLMLSSTRAMSAAKICMIISFYRTTLYSIGSVATDGETKEKKTCNISFFKACCMVSRRISKAHNSLPFIHFPLRIIDQSVP